MPLGDTIIALASAPGSSTRAVVRLSGPATRDALAALTDGPPRPFERACSRARLRLPRTVNSGRTVDTGSGRPTPCPLSTVHCPLDPAPTPPLSLPILLATYRAPASYTGEDSAEILLPGNPHLVERLLAAFTALPGIRPAAPGEFTARAYLNDRLSLDQAEGVAATIAAQTGAQLAAARDLLRGRTGDAYARWAADLAALLALVEAGIDFTDQEDVVPIAPADLHRRLLALAAGITARLGARAGSAAPGALPRVALAGHPSAGKSTLFNALLGRRRAVVAPAPGTTRDILEEQLDLSRDLPGAGSVLLCDAPGLEEVDSGQWTVDTEHAEGAESATTLAATPRARPPQASRGEGRAPAAAAAQRAARDSLAAADLILYCDPSARFPLRFNTPTLHLRTKADLPAAPVDSGPSATARSEGAPRHEVDSGHWTLDTARGDRPPFPLPTVHSPLPVCALDGFNLPALRRAIAEAATAARAGERADLLPRHRLALAAARDHLLAAAATLDPASRAPADPAITAGALRTALDHLGELTGRLSPDDIIGRIFATFCVGK